MLLLGVSFPPLKYFCPRRLLSPTFQVTRFTPRLAFGGSSLKIQIYLNGFKIVEKKQAQKHVETFLSGGEEIHVDIVMAVNTSK